ncbi:F-box domain-containing protein [Mycena indigotica]|uniref:F-box domain-containing protein n=1 Tax=Mycena indigotica TaxID=2126181 RepID=A0A8H6T426_9AGAR|nr:F-box domain-containing protein [Mycena indigotica]KAF7311690.1 F-box domain-containing protein [Mycena indigotica]
MGDMDTVNSPFHHILNTNAVPTDAECDSIRSFVEPHDATLLELDANVARLQLLLDDAIDKRDRLGGFVAAHKALLSPLRRMPEDILRLIFVQTLPGSRSASMHPSEGPLLLARVCRYWRDLALATPQLWSSIHIVVPQPDSSPSWGPEAQSSPSWAQAQALTSLTRWLDRGVKAPLEITLQLGRQTSDGWPVVEVIDDSAVDVPDSDDGARVTRESSPFLAALVAVASRWHNMRLWIRDTSDEGALAGLQAIDVPQLHTLQLINFGRGVSLPLLETASLRRLVIQGNFPAFPTNVQWHNLVSINIQASYVSPSGDEVETIEFPFPWLQQCTALEKLTVGVRGYPLQPAPLNSVVLSKLTMLDLGMFDAPTITDAITHLHAPVLHTLKIAHGGAGFLHHMDHLRCLVLTLDFLSTDELVAALRLVPALERLRLIGESTLTADPAFGFVFAQPDPAFLARLVPGPEPDAAPLCPALRHLELTRVLHVPDALIVRLLRARTLDLLAESAVTRLAEFNCYLVRAPQLDIRQELADCTELTLRISQQPLPPAIGYSALEGTEHDPLWVVGVPGPDGFVHGEGYEWLDEL